MSLRTAVTFARLIAPASHAAAARVLIAAGVPFRQACAYALHRARSARAERVAS